MSIKIIDCFPYNGENIVRLRLDVVYPYVDEIIVVEASETHSGKKKGFYYIDKYYDIIFKPYEDKIKILKLDGFNLDINQEWLDIYRDCEWINNKEVWFRETSQRDYPRSYLFEKSQRGEKFLLTCSDSDEIPNMELINKNLQYIYNFSNEIKEPIRLNMKLFYYSFKWITNEEWYKGFMTADVCIGLYTLDIMRNLKDFTNGFSNGGWHCSFFMNPEEIIRKLESFSHTECDKSEYKNEDYIMDCIEGGKDIIGRDNILFECSNDIILPI